MTAVSAPTPVIRQNPFRQEYLFLENVTWQDYERMLRLLGDRHLFVTFDRGRMEIMSPTPKHERLSRLIAKLVEIVGESLGQPVADFGSATLRNPEKLKGLEPDSCFYIAHESLFRGRDEIDLLTDPPPDLAVEVDVTHSSLDRMSIYGDLKVPEVWRFHDSIFGIYVLQPDGAYRASEASVAFPLASRSELQLLIESGRSTDNITWRGAIRKRVSAWSDRQ